MRLSSRTVWGWVLLLACVVPATATPLSGQLISPGKLATAHAELEGIRSCTQCHELLQRGVAPDLCLACHLPLASRIDVDEGFHASLTEDDCASCHKDHFGEDFALVRLDTLSFEHSLTGYGLEGKHENVSCRNCHTPTLIADEGVRDFKSEHGALTRTYLGLPQDCTSCHSTDQPHEQQFGGRACTECHDTDGWPDAGGFDHEETNYRLTGSHRNVTCAECHETTTQGELPDFVQYVGVESSLCTSCHSDEHAGTMPGTCSSCHNTGGWRDIDRSHVESTFDHLVTGFTLEGRHAAAPCASCHQSASADPLEGVHITFLAGTEANAFPSPATVNCLSCHVDRHSGVFEDTPGTADCAQCHGQIDWLPAQFDLTRHNAETDFTLVGAHLVLACNDCHVPTDLPPTFEIAATTCHDCHTETDPHEGQFDGRSCDECHDVNRFEIQTFDHSTTRFLLDGAHENATCDDCHFTESDAGGVPFVRYKPIVSECRDCHGELT